MAEEAKKPKYTGYEEYRGPYTGRAHPKIVEPKPRPAPKPARYASIGKGETREKAVAAPSFGRTEGGWEPEPLPEEQTAGGRRKGRDKLPKRGYLRDAVQLYDDRTADYTEGYEHRWNQRKYHWFFSNVTQSENGTVYSQPFWCAPFRWALILTNLNGSDAAALKIRVYPEFSWDGVSFFWFRQDWWGEYMMTGAMVAGGWRSAEPVSILAPWIRIAYTVSGVDQTEFKNLTITGIFNSV